MAMMPRGERTAEEYRQAIREHKQRAREGLLSSTSETGAFWRGYNLSIDDLMRLLDMMDDTGQEME